MLKIKSEKFKKYLILKVSGEATNDSSFEFSKKLEELAQEKCYFIGLELSELTYIDSYGLGVIIFFWKSVEAHQGKLVIVNPHPFIIDLLNNTKLNRIIPVLPKKEDLE